MVLTPRPPHPPPHAVRIVGFSLEMGTRLTRIAHDAVGATEPSTSVTPRRFSPIEDSLGIVPVLYAGQDLECALGETVFHDLDDDDAHAQSVMRADFMMVRASVLEVQRDCVIADLTDSALTRIGFHRDEIVNTDATPDTYRTTVLWAQYVWDVTDFSGLVWNSRRYRGGLAFMFFMRPDDKRSLHRERDLNSVNRPMPLYDGSGFGHVQTVASARNVTIIL